MLSENRYIRVFLAGLLFIVFAVGITPRQYLHDIFAKHKDSKAVIDHSNNSVGKSRYYCTCDDLVAESNFLCSEVPYEVHLTSVTSSIAVLEVRFSSVSPFYSLLRGPPAIS
jgi:hypothetical protein